MKSFESAVIDVILAKAAEAPDTKARCRYFEEPGVPCCIVGQALHENGALFSATDGNPRAPIHTAEGKWVIREGQFSSEANWELLGVEAPTLDQSHWVVRVQCEQDEGRTWGEAVERIGPPPVSPVTNSN